MYEIAADLSHVISAAVQWEQNITESGRTSRMQLGPCFIPVKVLVFHQTFNGADFHKSPMNSDVIN
jgi:hypothetical protein